jgi:ATP-dependent DNA helicase RecG
MDVTDQTTDILTLLDLGMGEKLHWFPEDVSISQLAATLTGFANSDGGMVILGISPDTGEVVGIKDTRSLCERIFRAAILTDPTLVLPLPQHIQLQKPGKSTQVQVTLLTVPAGLPHVFSLDGRYLGREGTQTNPLSPKRLYTLLNQRGSIEFENRQVPGARLTDLDITAVMDYASTRGGIATIELESAYEFLVRRGCLIRVDDSLAPNYAGLLLFGHYPQQWLPNATILAGRFPGLALADIYIRKDIDGNLISQLRQVEQFIQANLKTVLRLIGFQHRETLEYPLEAVRELVVNAVAHRDYNLQGDNIHLNIFADRLEISSPGLLPGPVTLQNLLEARFARNAIITQVLADLGYVERLGYGLDRVVQTTQEAGLPAPQFDEVAGTFKATLYAGFQGGLTNGKTPDLTMYENLDLNSRQKLALVELTKKMRLTNHQYQCLCPSVHAETLRRDLADLVKRGLIIKIGDKKATYYILKRV